MEYLKFILTTKHLLEYYTTECVTDLDNKVR